MIAPLCIESYCYVPNQTHPIPQQDIICRECSLSLI
jgi:hypothetical protein